MAVVKLRKAIIEGGVANLAVRSVRGDFVDIQARNLSLKSEKAVLWALSQIKARYQPEVFGVRVEAILGAATVSVFLETESPEVGAYSGEFEADLHFLIFNRALIRRNDAEGKRELMVSIFHELFHCMHEESISKESTSEFEAAFDLRCYQALDFPVPADHWAFKKLGIDVTKLSEGQKE
jgi:hypothetical protein